MWSSCISLAWRYRPGMNPLATIDDVYNELDKRASRLGYSPPRDLGKNRSQCYELLWKGTPILLVGFRDLARIPDYSAENRLWVEGFQPILRRVNECIGAGDDPPFIPPAYGIIYDNPARDFVLVPFRHLISTYSKRLEPRLKTMTHFSFSVVRDDEAYYLQTPRGGDNLPLRHVGTLEPLLSILERGRSADTRVHINDE